MYAYIFLQMKYICANMCGTSDHERNDTQDNDADQKFKKDWTKK